MPRNDAAATGHVCPGIRIHAIDIVQPPGIGISPMSDMDPHQAMVTAALATKSSAETPTNATTSALVLVVAAPPDARLVASPGGAVEPLVHAPEAVQPARIGGIRVVDDAVLEREGAHARPLARVRPRVRSASGGHLRDGPLAASLRDRLAPVVVVDVSFPLLRLGEADVEVEVEVAAERRRPRKRPPHAPLV